MRDNNQLPPRGLLLTYSGLCYRPWTRLAFAHTRIDMSLGANWAPKGAERLEPTLTS